MPVAYERLALTGADPKMCIPNSKQTICLGRYTNKRPPPSFSFIWMLPHPLSFLQILFVASFVLAQNWTGSPFIPPAIPLAVKSPYLQTWSQQGTAVGSLNSAWESFRDGTVSHLLEFLWRIPDTYSSPFGFRSLRGWECSGWMVIPSFGWETPRAKTRRSKNL